MNGGGERNRTDDLLLAKQALSQLSYTPAQSQMTNVIPRSRLGSRLARVRHLEQKKRSMNSDLAARPAPHLCQMRMPLRHVHKHRPRTVDKGIRIRIG